MKKCSMLSFVCVGNQEWLDYQSRPRGDHVLSFAASGGTFGGSQQFVLRHVGTGGVDVCHMKSIALLLRHRSRAGRSSLREVHGN